MIYFDVALITIQGKGGGRWKFSLKINLDLLYESMY